MTKSAAREYKRIGLTGGIGTGKSLAAKRFAELGARVYHADELARQALEPGAVCYNRVIDTFGNGVRNQDGTINRKSLAQVVFSSEDMRKKLNDIVHPYVIETIVSIADQDCTNERGTIAIFEVPLLFESGADRQMDANIVVQCDLETRIDRIIKRDGGSREQALSRIRTQMPEEEKARLADFLLENNSTEEALFHQIDLLYEVLKKM